VLVNNAGALPMFRAVCYPWAASGRAHVQSGLGRRSADNVVAPAAGTALRSRIDLSPP
jgi:hypothetical protein